jgi:uncharacterized protein YfiM (DUF2279 family)
MPRTILLAVLAAFAVSTSARAEISQDKYLHAGVSAAVAAGATTLTAKSPNRFWYGVGAGLAVGVAKEIADSKEARNRFDAKDVWADLVGSVAGAYLADSMLHPVVKRQPRGYALGLQASMPLK